MGAEHAEANHVGHSYRRARWGEARADLLDDCQHSYWPDLRMLACDAIINDPMFGPGDKALAYRHRGEVRTEAGALDEAVGDFTASINLNSTSALTLGGRGQAKLLAGEFSKAVADYDQAIRLSPNSAELYFGRGLVDLAAANFDASIRDFTDAIRLSPNNARAYNNRGLAFRKKGDDAHAAQDYSMAIAINPVYALAYANRGYLNESRGRKNEAIEDLREALWLDPSQTEVRAALRRLGAEDAAAIESERRVHEGRILAEINCSGCHAVGSEGASPYRRAPELRTLSRRYRLLALREPITRAVAAPHDQMPHFVLSDFDIDTLVAYINSLSGPR